MATLLERYLAGEHERVWAELLALGATQSCPSMSVSTALMMACVPA